LTVLQLKTRLKGRVCVVGLAYRQEARMHDQDKWTKRAFIPEPDISTYELAEIFSSVWPTQAPRAGVDFREDVWQSLPAGIKRHFKEMSRS
jgi:hypothetical protein